MRSFRIWLAKLIGGEHALVIPRHTVEPLRTISSVVGFGASNDCGPETWPALKVGQVLTTRLVGAQEFTAVNWPPSVVMGEDVKREPI